MSNYFRRLPNLDYPSLLKTRKSNLDFVQTKNLFRRAKVREDLFANFMQFDKYKIIGDERPDNVSEKVYGTNNFDWVVLMANNIIDVYNEWPLTQQQLNRYLNDKYTPQELVSIHHHETVEFRDRNNQVILPAGLIVDENWSMEYFSGGQIRSTDTPSSTSNMSEKPVKSVTFLEFETRLNEDKRNINVLKPDLIGLFLKDFDRVMKYDKSSQYINRKLKKTENPRIK
tara:strand:- start:22 stop:705 length:684 start_codon:yes stop_codon:yes gene_type:complete